MRVSTPGGRHETCFSPPTHVGTARVKYLRDKITYRFSPGFKKSESKLNVTKVVHTCPEDLMVTSKLSAMKSKSTTSLLSNRTVSSTTSRKEREGGQMSSTRSHSASPLRKSEPSEILRESPEVSSHKTSSDKSSGVLKLSPNRLSNSPDLISPTEVKKVVLNQLSLIPRPHKQMTGNFVPDVSERKKSSTPTTFPTMSSINKNKDGLKTPRTSCAGKVLLHRLDSPTSSDKPKVSTALESFKSVEKKKSVNKVMCKIKKDQVNARFVCDRGSMGASDVEHRRINGHVTHEISTGNNIHVKQYYTIHKSLANDAFTVNVTDITRQRDKIRSDRFFQNLLLRNVKNISPVRSTQNSWIQEKALALRKRLTATLDPSSQRATAVYLKHTKPVTESKFRHVDLIRSRSVSPKYVSWEDQRCHGTSGAILTRSTPSTRSVSLPPMTRPKEHNPECPTNSFESFEREVLETKRRDVSSKTRPREHIGESSVTLINRLTTRRSASLPSKTYPREHSTDSSATLKSVPSTITKLKPTRSVIYCNRASSPATFISNKNGNRVRGDKIKTIKSSSLCDLNARATNNTNLVSLPNGKPRANTKQKAIKSEKQNVETASLVKLKSQEDKIQKIKERNRKNEQKYKKPREKMKEEQRTKTEKKYGNEVCEYETEARNEKIYQQTSRNENQVQLAKCTDDSLTWRKNLGYRSERDDHGSEKNEHQHENVKGDKFLCRDENYLDDIVMKEIGQDGEKECKIDKLRRQRKNKCVDENVVYHDVKKKRDAGKNSCKQDTWHEYNKTELHTGYGNTSQYLKFDGQNLNHKYTDEKFKSNGDRNRCQEQERVSSLHRSQTRVQIPTSIHIHRDEFKQKMTDRSSPERRPAEVIKRVSRSKSSGDVDVFTAVTDVSTPVIRNATSVESLHRKEYQTYVGDLLQSSAKSVRFKELSSFYATIEKLRELELKAESSNVTPVRHPYRPIIDYDRWMSVRARERAERELKAIYDDLKRRQEAGCFLFMPKWVESFRWDERQEWGLRRKEKSVEDLREEFERARFTHARPNFVERHEISSQKQTYKPLWRAKSVIDMAKEITEKRSASEGRRDRFLDRCLENQTRASLSVEQVDSLKKQLVDIYENGRGKSMKRSMNSKISERCDVQAGLNTAHTECEERKSSLDLSQKLAEKQQRKNQTSSSLIFAKETRGAIAAAGAATVLAEPPSPRTCYSLEMSEDGRRDNDNDFLLVLADNVDTTDSITETLAAWAQPKSTPTGNYHSKPSSSETESASTDESAKTAIFIGRDAVKGKVEYFERATDAYTPTVHVAKDEDYVPPRRRAASCQNVKEFFGENALIKLAETPLRLTGKKLTPRHPQLTCVSMSPLMSTSTSYDSIRRSRSSSPWPRSTVDTLRRTFEKSIKSEPRRCNSDPQLQASGTSTLSTNNTDHFNWIEGRREHHAGAMRGRSRVKRSGVVSPSRFNIYDRLMPRIDVISKIAVLHTRDEIAGKNPITTDVPVGVVKRLRDTFDANAEDVSILGRMFTSSPDVREVKDVAPYLAASWVAHKYPKMEDNARIESSANRGNARPKSVSPPRRKNIPMSILKRSATITTLRRPPASLNDEPVRYRSWWPSMSTHA